MKDIRVGQGFDVHRLGAAQPLRLGGVEIASRHGGLQGHSDADVVVHAVASALLGSLALGDLGTHFPDTESRWQGASSLDLLARVVALVLERGYRVHQCDVTVVAEEPRLAPHVEGMRRNLASVLQRTLEDVSIKATRAEKLGALGRVEGIAAQAVVLVVRD